MLRAAASRCAGGAIRRLSVASYPAAVGARRKPPQDEGDWSYYKEWWGEDDGPGDGAHTVFRRHSEHGNGVVSVVAYPASIPVASDQWPVMERWLQERNLAIYPESSGADQFKILGYQWRVMRFNDHTRQSTAKVMACYRFGGDRALYSMQQPNCLAVPYVKSMVSAGLTALPSCSYDLPQAVSEPNTMKILCIGHGGGSIPLFLASKFRGADVHIVEIDPVVVSASVESMGFPASCAKGLSAHTMQPTDGDELLWNGVHDRISLHIEDAEDFIAGDSNVYDLVFIDAYDGNDIFPRKLWDADGAFLRNLEEKVHPLHGTVVVNLHSDSGPSSPDVDDEAPFENVLPMGRYVSHVCRAYKRHFGLAFTVASPWLCNITLVACRDKAILKGAPVGRSCRDFVLSKLLSRSSMVEQALDLPFPCLQYVKNGFTLVE
uniref:S-adenosyl-L-methionine-dependent methyltransferase superfamily protein n=1 Tax=Aegilops tauschii subsp. strangulata TaxID=200361 RepID=A0A453CEW7_AEGTS